MLSSDELAELAAAIVATAETLGQTISASASEMMADDLAEFPQPVIAGALRACRRELTGKLTLAAILQRIQGADGRPEPNEAWAIAVDSFDQAATVLMTPEIQQAASVVMPIYQGRDKVGARMAFLATYERLVVDARQQGVAVSWVLSLGHSQEGRSLAIETAQRLGRLPAPVAQELLEYHHLESIANDGSAIAGLLTGEAGEATPEVHSHLEKIRKRLARRQKAKLRLRDRHLRHEREDMARRRAAVEETIKNLEEARYG